MKLFDLFKRKKHRARRNYAAADTGRLYNNWTTTNKTSDSDLQAQLYTIRARSRELAMNNDHTVKFFAMGTMNIIGKNGIALQVNAKDLDGKPDTSANKYIERNWREWSELGVCSACGSLSWLDIEKMSCDSVMRDGEFLIRMVEGFDNPFMFALQMIEADHLNENYNIDKLPNGNSIRMGIEVNPWGRPVAYHLLKEHPGRNTFSTYMESSYTRIPAEEIIHLFIKKRPTQSRGIPWLHSAMTRLKMLGGYEEAELVSARASAAKMAVIKTQTGTEYIGDDEDESGNIIMDMEPGVVDQLPAGWDIDLLDPKHPGGNFEPFTKSILRSIASGLNVSYNSLASDLEGVNFSSIRSGVLEEREMWRMLQGWFIQHLHNIVFRNWLRASIMAGKIKLPFDKFSKFNSPKWSPRGWAWVDPFKDQKSNELAIANKTKTRAAVVAEDGLDLEDVFEQLQKEEDLAKKYKLTLHEAKTGSNTGGPGKEKTNA